MFELETKKRFVGSTEQKRIWDEMRTGTSHILVQAGPGAGKSTTVVEGVRKIYGKKCCVVAFNKGIQEELQKKVAGVAEAYTLHGLGFRLLQQNIGKVKLEGKKLRNMYSQYSHNLKKNDEAFYYSYSDRRSLFKLVSLMKGEGVVIDKQDAAEMSYAADMADDLMALHQITFETLTVDPAEHAYQLLIMSLDHELWNIDYDDMLWLPYVNDYTCEKFDLMVVDEAQDLNLVQQTLIQRLAHRLVLVGDKNQSIYSFRGAGFNSMERMKMLLESTEQGVRELPLMTSFRCPKKVIGLAQKLEPGLRAREDAPDGTVSVVSSFQLDDMAGAGDLIVCRMNAPLFQKLFQYWAQDKGAYLRGKAVLDSLDAVVKSLRAYTVEEAKVKLLHWEEKQKLLLTKQKRRSMIPVMQDKASCIRMVLRACGQLSKFRDTLDMMFDDTASEEKVQLASVHQAKGLEADRVFILRPELMPHFLAQSTWEKEQEKNVGYVAVTRSKRELYFVGDVSPLFD